MTKNNFLSKLKMFNIKIFFISYLKYAHKKYSHQYKKINFPMIYIYKKKGNLTILYNFKKFRI